MANKSLAAIVFDESKGFKKFNKESYGYKGIPLELKRHGSCKDEFMVTIYLTNIDLPYEEYKIGATSLMVSLGKMGVNYIPSIRKYVFDEESAANLRSCLEVTLSPLVERWADYLKEDCDYTKGFLGVYYDKMDSYYKLSRTEALNMAYSIEEQLMKEFPGIRISFGLSSNDIDMEGNLVKERSCRLRVSVRDLYFSNMPSYICSLEQSQKAAEKLKEALDIITMYKEACNRLDEAEAKAEELFKEFESKYLERA